MIQRIAKQQEKMFYEYNKAKIQYHRSTPKFKYGIQLPRNYDDAIRLDKRNGNTLWQDAVKLEMQQISSYNVFKDLGKNANIPDGYKRIRVHLVFDVKHDGRHKGHLVADGHLTDIPVDSVYSGVVSLRGFRLLVF